jgi:ParB family transcriptional regulator, chromosome partitioning protein
VEQGSRTIVRDHYVYLGSLHQQHERFAKVWDNNGFRALLNLEESKYSIEQIATRTGKPPAYVAGRLKLTELAPIMVAAFYREEIGVSHALLLAKLQPDQQEQALSACFKEDWSNGGQKAKRILLPVRNLQFWIESNILLILKLAPFDKRDGQFVPAAGSCVTSLRRNESSMLRMVPFFGRPLVRRRGDHRSGQ